MLQLWIAVTGLLALSLSLLMPNTPAGRHWACVGPFVGLAGQPAWIWMAIDARQLGVLIVSVAYTVIWLAACVRVVRGSRTA